MLTPTNVKGLTQVDIALLRARLHETVDRALDDFIDDQGKAAAAADASGREPVERIATLAPFDFTWPAQEGSEAFESATEYRFAPLAGGASVVVAWTTRHAWNRDRRRAVVFGRYKRDDAPAKWYPWTEFVQTDRSNYAASIPDPQRPRAILSEGEPLPPRFAGKTVARSDALFDSIREGGSLRLVVDESEEADMVRHGYWVATLRGRV